MIVSESRASANRRNAQLSTGPKTAEGKERSRANALKHGLRASVVVEEDLELVQIRTQQLFHSLKPQNEYHNWLVDKAAILSIRIDRSERIERRARDKACLRAALTWDEDRQVEVERAGARLSADPAQTIAALQLTPQGCEWLMSRWAMLAYIADVDTTWTADQTTLAFDLLATPISLRIGRRPGESLDFEGKAYEPAINLAVVARREIARLKEIRERVADVDETDRAVAEADLTNERNPELKNLRRYEATLHRRLRWCVSQISDPSPHQRPANHLTPNWMPTFEPVEKPTADEKLAAAHPSNAIHPPFDLEPDEYPEPGQSADIPAILRSRRAKQLRKSEARRDSKRRRVEKLRA